MKEHAFWVIVEAQGKVVGKDDDGATTIEIETEEGRSQLVRISVQDLGGNLGECTMFGSLVCEVADLDCEKALRFNATVVRFGAIAIMEDMVIVRETLRLATCDSDEILFTLAEVAGVADGLEKKLSGSDRY